MKKSKLIPAFTVGFINSLFGAGGGMVSVPFMRKLGLNQKKAQATTLSVILPLSTISVILYLINGDFSLSSAIRYIPFGMGGAVIGVLLTKNVENSLLRKLFGLFMIWSGIRMIW